MKTIESEIAKRPMQRRAEHVLRPFEAWALPRLARALPAWVLPDHLTALGMCAAVVAGLCFALSAESRAFLWLGNACILLNWFGDSLDGTLARERRIERPHYGFYLDHMTDMLSAAAILCGLGISPYMSMNVALVVIIAYYLLAINTHLQLKTLGVYDIAYHGVGPTEARLILIACNAAVALSLLPARLAADSEIEVLDPLALALAFSMLGSAGLRSVKNLRLLALREPQPVAARCIDAAASPRS